MKGFMRCYPAVVAFGFGLLFVAAATGCNRGLDLVPVEGMVTYEGLPLAKAGVLFRPGSGPPAMGSTDEEGRFTLRTANQPGAFVGDYQVTVAKTEHLSKQIPGQVFPITQVRYLIPQRYANPDTSRLTATVIDDDNYFEFKLTK
jgi:hypothetical protein